MTTTQRLGGKVAMVTGGAQGIGEGIARVFAQNGAKVVIADVQEDRGRATAEALGGVYQALDVRQAEAWDKAVSATVERFGRLDVLVNNAGTGITAHIETADVDEHRNLMDLNLTGVWLGIRAVAKVMADQGGGSIINISSIDGLAGMPYLSSYVATKFAVTGMTKSLAMELGDRNVRVNSVHPGIIETPLVRSVTGPLMDRLVNATKRQPIKRMGRPEEIGYAALFFASDESAYCTGTSLVVDGGHLAGPYRDPAPE